MKVSIEVGLTKSQALRLVDSLRKAIAKGGDSIEMRIHRSMKTITVSGSVPPGYAHLWWTSGAKWTVQKGIICPMGHYTNIQRYDSKAKVWTWYCEKCQAPIGEAPEKETTVCPYCKDKGPFNILKSIIVTNGREEKSWLKCLSCKEEFTRFKYVEEKGGVKWRFL